MERTVSRRTQADWTTASTRLARGIWGVGKLFRLPDYPMLLRAAS
jgi:hypothetical protein